MKSKSPEYKKPVFENKKEWNLLWILWRNLMVGVIVFSVVVVMVVGENINKSKKKEIDELEKDVLRMHKEGLNPVTIAARTGFRSIDVRAIISRKGLDIVTMEKSDKSDANEYTEDAKT